MGLVNRVWHGLVPLSVVSQRVDPIGHRGTPAMSATSGAIVGRSSGARGLFGAYNGLNRSDRMSQAVESRHFIQQMIDADIESGKWGAPGDRSVVTTRFPPEPNGYLHLGHTKAIILSCSIAREYGGRFFLRFDDTNPTKEEQEFVDSIKGDIEWLGAKWDGEPKFASDYFEQLYAWAIELIEKGLAYVDDQSVDEIRAGRGNLKDGGKGSPFRDRTVDENLDLFARMKGGEFENGTRVLRAKIDMNSPNMNLRDPLMYRIVNTPHHRTGDTWHIYPMYDWAHGLEDSIEGVTHSLCTLEFEDHRPLYDWFIDAINHARFPVHDDHDQVRWAVEIWCKMQPSLPASGALSQTEPKQIKDLMFHVIDALYETSCVKEFFSTEPSSLVNWAGLHQLCNKRTLELATDCLQQIQSAAQTDQRAWIHYPQQIEFSRLFLSYTNMSKRFMRQLVEENHVNGWDDPRMITVAGFRRRGYTPESFWKLAEDVGITKFNAMVDFSRLENMVREDLNERAPRRMAVLDPIKLVISNWADGGDADRVEVMEAANHPKDESMGTRPLNFGRELWIEREDFMIDPPKKFFRLGIGREVRLRSGYWVKCHEYKTDSDGNITEVHCTYDPLTKGGNNPPADEEGKVRKVKGTIHWVNIKDALDAEVRLFDRLYRAERPGKKTGDHLDDLNPDSLKIITDAKVEPGLIECTSDELNWSDGIRRFQFERTGYFCEDRESDPDNLVFNRTASLRDSWVKHK
jgi:glutaminyl-tRNA synthetase